MRDMSFTGPHAVLRRWLWSARARAPYDVYAGKREHPRYPWDRTVDLKTRNRVVRGCGRDISKTGLGIVCSDQLPEGERIAVRYHPHGGLGAGRDHSRYAGQWRVDGRDCADVRR